MADLAFLRATSEIQRIHEITEEKEMYDSREKAILDYESNLIHAREEGEGIGVERGQLIGRIQLLQELLGGTVLSTEELTAFSLEQLSSTMKNLQTKLRLRDA
ncbi:MAG: hypothetical protein NTY15_18795 [Planctomycetota bacterium]|nr:hypothetical protein [Planctomycetota bacterium]